MKLSVKAAPFQWYGMLPSMSHHNGIAICPGCPMITVLYVQADAVHDNGIVHMSMQQVTMVTVLYVQAAPW